MSHLSKVNVLREIDDAIRVSSNLYGKNVEEIEKSFHSEEWKVGFLVVYLPVIVVLVITASLTFLGMPLSKSFYVSILFAFCLAAYFFAYCIKKELKLYKEKDKILENEVDISNDVLCTIYSKIQPQIDIEPKFIVNIRELDVLRDCFFDRISINIENKKLAFLNPKTKNL